MTKYKPFFYDNKFHYAPNAKCYTITGNNLKYLIGLLNSWLFDFCFRDRFPELQGGTIELQKVFFEKLELPIISDDNIEFANNIIFNVDKIINSENDDDISIFSKSIDENIFKLYNLNQSEIDFIKDFLLNN